MNNKINEITLLLRDLAETPSLDAQVLLAHITGQSRAWVLAHPDMDLTCDQQAKLTDSVSQLVSGVPLPYIIGCWEFYGLDLIVTQDVLIPRPETELLVDKALDWLRANPVRRKVIDTGTGSGCIAVALANHIPDLQVIASDISDAAIRVAKKNAHKFNVSDRIEFVCCHLFPAKSVGVWSRSCVQTAPPSSGADLIVANLPYIPTSILRGLKVYGREPELALDGGEDGLDVIRQFFGHASEFLEPGGMILMEIEASQGMSILSIAHDFFPEAIIYLHQDLSGKDRLLEINLQP